MSLARYYKRIVLLPTILIIGGFIFFIIYDLIFGPGRIYKSEWLSADSVDEYVIVLVVLHCLIVCGLCLSVFLIRRPGVRTNKTLTFFSWFLLPMLYLGYLLYQIGRSFYNHVDENGARLALGLLTLPYIASLIVTFIQFRRSPKAPSRRAAK